MLFVFAGVRGSGLAEEVLARRVAEREGRRIRRARARELRGVDGHAEGMSSDEEVTEAEALNLRTLRGKHHYFTLFICELSFGSGPQYHCPLTVFFFRLT